MDNKDITIAGILCVLTMLAGYGGSVFLNRKNLDNTYICPLTEEVAVFDRLSGSGKTGYYSINDSWEVERCNEGRKYAAWVKLSEYTEINEKSFETKHKGIQRWKCSSEACNKIE